MQGRVSGFSPWHLKQHGQFTNLVFGVPTGFQKDLASVPSGGLDVGEYAGARVPGCVLYKKHRGDIGVPLS